MPTQTSFTETAGEVFEDDNIVLDVVDTESDPKEDLKDKIVLTKEEYENLNKKTESTNVLNEGLKSLADTLKEQRQPIQPQAPTAPEIDIDALEQEAFTKGGFASAVKKVAEQLVGQTVAPLAQNTAMQSKRLMKLDPNTSEYFNKYEAEIEAMVQSAPPQYRVMPDIYEKAYQQVIMNHQSDIIADKAAKLAKEEVAKALAEAGIKPAAKDPGLAMYQENGTPSVTPLPAQSNGKIRVTAAEKDAVEQFMLAKGMNLKDPEQVGIAVQRVRELNARRR